jgi:hypothetical protein
MGRDLALAGFRLTAEEWDDFDEDSQQQLLATFGAEDPEELALDPPYDSLELSFD